MELGKPEQEYIWNMLISHPQDVLQCGKDWTACVYAFMTTCQDFSEKAKMPVGS